jgi:hypothetical protein
MRVGAPIVWHRPPDLVPRRRLDPLDAALLEALGAPAHAQTWVLRMRVQEPWTISVQKLGTLEDAGSLARATVGTERLELWDLPGTQYTRRADGSTIQDPPTVDGLAWICRIVDGDGRILVEDHWSPVEERYHRQLDAERLALAARLGRFIFDNGAWGAGRPQGRQASISEIMNAILEFRGGGKGNPSQEEVVAMPAIPYDDVRSLQRALDGLTWQDVLDEASQIEADRAAYPGKVVIRGFAYVGKAAR